MTGKRVYLETFGCQMNALDSELATARLLALGFAFVDRLDDADVVLLNTCSVRQHAEDKVNSRLGELGALKSRRPEMIVGVIGCMAERDGDGILQRAPHVDLLCGPAELNKLPALIAHAQASGQPAIALHERLNSLSTEIRRPAELEDLEALDRWRPISAVGPSRQAYVRITRGCNKWCSFCVVPMVRGPEVHRPPDAIVDEVRQLADGGVMEVTLLGQTVNHYKYVAGDGRTTTFAELLVRIHDAVPHLPRLRFVTSYPRDFGDDALAAMASCPRICRYLHLPVQSGSNEVLRRMNRGYTREQYAELLQRARGRLPDVTIAGDMIVGFPGETEDDFAASINLMHEARYKSCFVFKYSPRPGTAADRRHTDDVPNEVKRRRNNELLAVQKTISLEHNRRLIGQRVEVLCEGYSKAALRAQEGDLPADGWKQPDQLVGRTRSDEIVVFPGSANFAGRLVTVEIEAASFLTLFGRLIDADRPKIGAHRVTSLPIALT
jgi:tRNA-2-methylthio-N6-dimethylallyladenosine synthase